MEAFRGLHEGGKHVLILHIAEQNAGLLIQRENLTIHVEAFEASPRSKDVLASKTLQWDFPGGAISIPLATFDNENFQNELATFLEQASTESVKQFGAQAYKSGAYLFESRDTGDPFLITQLLMTLFEVNGTKASPPILRECQLVFLLRLYCCTFPHLRYPRQVTNLNHL